MRAGNVLRVQAYSGAGVQATLHTDVRNWDGTSDHVVIRRRSRAASGRAVLLVAHRDTTHVSPGANDNGSGVAVVLEVLRATALSDLAFDLVGLFTAAEEGGGIGVAQIAAGLAAAKAQVESGGSAGGLGAVDEVSAVDPVAAVGEGSAVRAVGASDTVGAVGAVGAIAAINLDMLAVGGPLRLVTGSAAQSTSSRLNSLLRAAAAELGYELCDYICPMGLADAGPLIAAGIKSTWLFKPDDPRFHTEDDGVDYVNPNDLKVAAEVVVRALELMGRL